MKRLRALIADHKTATIWTVAITLIVVLIVTVTILGFVYEWRTGFVDHYVPKEVDKEFIPGKTLWDVLGLIIIPLALVLIAYFFNKRQKENELEIAQKQREQDLEIAKEERETERQIAKDREEERALQSYLEAMTRLILEEKLGTKEEVSGARTIARSRTLTILSSLDDGQSDEKWPYSRRKGSVLGFLYEAGLIGQEGVEVVINLEKADLLGANLMGTNLEGAYLGEANLMRACLIGACLMRANLRGADLEEAILERADLVGADLMRAYLLGAILGGANLGGVILREANLMRAYLREANLRGADLEEAILIEANLEEANLIGVNLRGAYLGKTNLRGAILREAILEGAILEGAILEGAILEGADLEGADLEGAKYYLDTTWPEDFDPKKTGAKLVEY